MTTKSSKAEKGAIKRPLIQEIASTQFAEVAEESKEPPLEVKAGQKRRFRDL